MKKDSSTGEARSHENCFPTKINDTPIDSSCPSIPPRFLPYRSRNTKTPRQRGISHISHHPHQNGGGSGKHVSASCATLISSQPRVGCHFAFAFRGLQFAWDEYAGPVSDEIHRLQLPFVGRDNMERSGLVCTFISVAIVKVCLLISLPFLYRL